MTTITLANGTVLINPTIAAGNIDLITDNTAVYLQGTVVNAGTIELNAAGNVTQLIMDSQIVTLTGGGTLLLSNNPANEIFGNGPGNAGLFNINNTIEGAGYLGINNGNDPLALTNGTAGIINANDSNALVIEPGGPAVINNGLMEATGTGGLVITNGAVINQTGGGRLFASGAGDNVYFQNGADIIGGTLTGTLGGEFQINSGTANFGDGGADTLTIAKSTTVQVNDNTQLELQGTINNLGTLALASSGNATNLILNSATVSLIGGGTLLLSDYAANEIYGISPGDQTLLNVNNTIKGAGNIGVNNGNVPLSLTNEKAGIINANGTVALIIQTGGPALVNAGLLEATGTGGLVVYNTAIDNTGTLLASGAGHNIYLENGSDVIGGVLKDTGGGLIESNSGVATLDGSAAAVTIALGTTVQVNDNQQLNLLGTIDNLGTLAMASIGNSTNIVIQSSTLTLIGGGTLALSDNVNNRIYGASGGDQVLINVNNLIEGAGQIGVNNGNIPLSLTNQTAGIIDANGTAPLYIQSGGPAVVNHGLLEATGGGGLIINNTFIDDTAGGVIKAIGTGSVVQLINGADIAGGTLATSNGGLIEIAAGTDTLDGSTAPITIAAGSTVRVNDNLQLNLLGTLDLIGTLALGSTGDTTNLVLNSTIVTLLGGGTIAMSDNIYNRIYGNSPTDQTLINVDDTITGAGQIGVNNGFIPLALTNEAAGVINASSTASLYIQTGGPAVINAGLIEATNTGGLVITNNTAIDQTTGTLLASGTGDNIYLQNGADIVGGVLEGTGGGLFLANGGNVQLDGSTAAITLATATNLQLSDNQQLFLLGTVDNLGTISLGSTGDTTNLILNSPTVTLLGGGELLLSDNIYNRIYGNSPTTDTLINVNNTIAGAGQIGVSNGFIPLALTNEAAGVIDATGTASLYLQSGGPAFFNAGLIEATNTGGIIITNNTAIDQTGGTLLASGAGNNVYLQNGGTIAGGVLRGTGGGIFEANAGNAFLDGSTGAVTIALGTTFQLEDNQQLLLRGTIDNAGTININAAADTTNLLIDSPTVSLAGGGTLRLSATGNARIYGDNTTNTTLINVNNTIIGAGDLGVNNGFIPLALTNATAGVIDANDTAPLYIQSGGPQDSNAGLMEATGGGSLLVISTAITNTATGTIAAFNASTVQFDSNSNLVNAAAGTLTGGTYGAFATTGGATLNLTGGGPVTVDAANLILSGTNATIGFYNNGAYTAIETSLTEVTGAGTLQIDNGRDYATANQLAIDTGGHLDLAAGTLAPAALTSAGTIFGYGTITGGIANTGKIEASGGKLAVGGNITGGGSIAIDAGAAFELGSASSEAIVFAPGTVQSGSFVAGTAILDKPALYTGTFTGFGAGDTIDLAGTLASSASIAGSKLVVSLTTGGTLSYALANPATGTRVAVSSDGHGGTNIIDFQEATASAISPTPVNFGEHHTAAPLVETYTISNTAAANPYSEKLNASMGSTTGAVTDSGSFTGLAAGATNNSALHATLASSTGGVVSGTATVKLSTTGAGVAGDGLGTLALSSETVSLSGTFYNYATASTAAPVNFGQAHIGSALTQNVIIANNAAPGIYSEGLDASFSGTSANLAGSGSVSHLAAGSTSALALTLSGTTAGVQTGAATIALASDGAGIDTLGVTTLPSETVTTTGTLFNEATASTQPGTISFGIVHVGQTVSQFLTLTNTASPGLYSENLDGSFSGTSSSIATTGSVFGLAAGGTSSGLSVGLQTSKAGTIGGFTTLNLASDGSGIDSLGTTALGADTIAVTGTVNHYASVGVALISGPGSLSVSPSGVLKLNLGSVTQGSAAPTEQLGIVNAAVGPADLLKGNISLSGTTGAFTDTSAISFSGLAAGGTNTGHTIALHTNTLGTFSETIVLHPTGYNSSGYAGTLANDTLVVTGTVTAAAAAMHFIAPAPALAPAAPTTPLTGLAAWLHLPDLRTGPAATGFAPPDHALLAAAAPQLHAMPTATGAGLLTPLLYHNPEATQAALLGRPI